MSSGATCVVHAEGQGARGAGMSPEFCNLVAQLLDKDPGKRIGWAQLPEHSFWQAPLALRAMPPEPHLAAFVAAQRPAALAPASAPALPGVPRQVLTCCLFTGQPLWLPVIP